MPVKVAPLTFTTLALPAFLSAIVPLVTLARSTATLSLPKMPVTLLAGVAVTATVVLPS